MECNLCDVREGDEIYQGNAWRVVVNYNQNKLGKCMVCLNRHDEDICNLSEGEVQELWSIIRRLKAALDVRFQPDHYNYSFLMNLDAHVHLHVVPRYKSPRRFAGVEFRDSESLPVHKPSPEIYGQLVGALKGAL